MSGKITYLLVAEDPFDISNRLPPSDDETVLDRKRYRASYPCALSEFRTSQQVVCFRDSPEYAVLLWQQRDVCRRTDAMKRICAPQLSISADTDDGPSHRRSFAQT